MLAKRFTNPSADIITVLAGLDEVDAVFFNFAGALEHIVRTGRSRKSVSDLVDLGVDVLAVAVRQKAIEVALSLTSGAWQTSLVSYFTHRDLFPALMKVLAVHFFLYSLLTIGYGKAFRLICCWTFYSLMPYLPYRPLMRVLCKVPNYIDFKLTG